MASKEEGRTEGGGIIHYATHDLSQMEEEGSGLSSLSFSPFSLGAMQPQPGCEVCLKGVLEEKLPYYSQFPTFCIKYGCM